MDRRHPQADVPPWIHECSDLHPSLGRRPTRSAVRCDRPRRPSPPPPPRGRPPGGQGLRGRRLRRDRARRVRGRSGHTPPHLTRPPSTEQAPTSRVGARALLPNSEGHSKAHSEVPHRRRDRCGMQPARYAACSVRGPHVTSSLQRARHLTPRTSPRPDDPHPLSVSALRAAATVVGHTALSASRNHPSHPRRGRGRSPHRLRPCTTSSCGGPRAAIRSGVVRQEFVRVHDPVGVALFGEEALPVGGEVLVDGVAGDDGVEVRLVAVGLGAQDPAQPLGLLLA